MAEGNAGPPGHSITRSDLEQVIRRAIELSLNEPDTQERLSENDLIRIGEELGLPARSVRLALYERPSLTVPPIAGSEALGSPIVASNRVIRGDVATTRRRLEEYLGAQEYLTVARRTADELQLIPAEDAISSVARVFARPKRRHYLAHARRVVVALHPLPDEEAAAVRVEIDLNDQRLEHRRGAYGMGMLAGLGGLFVGAMLGDAVVTGAASEIASWVGAAAGAVPSAWAAFTGWARRFRHTRAEAQLELDGLLDRLEAGERLEPPPAPWKRRLGLGLKGPDR